MFRKLVDLKKVCIGTLGKAWRQGFIPAPIAAGVLAMVPSIKLRDLRQGDPHPPALQRFMNSERSGRRTVLAKLALNEMKHSWQQQPTIAFRSPL